jgi:hypothetical protein
MRERDRWWGFFRGDIEWHRIPDSDGKGKSRNKMQYEIDVSRRSEKMRGWQIYEEPLSWDQSDDDTAQLTNKPGGNDDALVKNTNDSQRGENSKPESSTQKDESIAKILIASPNSDASRKVVTNGPFVCREPTPRLLSLLNQVTCITSCL